MTRIGPDLLHAQEDVQSIFSRDSAIVDQTRGKIPTHAWLPELRQHLLTIPSNLQQACANTEQFFATMTETSGTLGPKLVLTLKQLYWSNDPGTRLFVLLSVVLAVANVLVGYVPLAARRLRIWSREPTHQLASVVSRIRGQAETR